MSAERACKQTEVGLIPEDWDVIPLAGLCRSICDGTHFTPKYVDSGIPFYSVENVTADDFANTKFISPEEHSLLIKRCKPERGDILMTRITAGVLGDTRILDWDVNASIYVSLALLKPNDRILPEYLYRYSRSTAFVRDVEKRGLANATPKKINMRDIGAIPIPVPRLEAEQRAIATALSDVDELLGGLDRLIAKKRDLKHAGMQQLLTGQTRLPGFRGEWEVKTLGKVFEIAAGKSKSAYIVDGGDFVICDMGSVSTDGHLITSKRTNYRGDFLCKGDLIMPKDDIGGGKIIGKVGYVDCADTYVLGDHVYRLRALSGDPLFLSFLINSHSINSALRKKVIGSAQLGLGRRSVQEQEIPFPSPAEQAAIAETLSEMDAELAALEQRRQKTSALKEAMMQELLTGRTRLVSRKEIHA
jgi:type I restriction enzyme, S subunit